MNTPIKIDRQSLTSLADWSKWLITINFLSATGCIIALKTADEIKPKIGAVFFMAIVFFCLSVICSTLFIFLLAKLDLKPDMNMKKYTWLATLQWILFTIGLFFVLAWIGFLTKVF